jgi:hypothetical protein
VFRRTNGTLNERREETNLFFSRQRLLENVASPFHSFVFYAGARHEHARATQRLPLSVTGESRARHFTLRPAVTPLNSLEISSLTIDTQIFFFS